jgi:hypothetical protein
MQVEKAGRFRFRIGVGLWFGRSAGRADWHNNDALQTAPAPCLPTVPLLSLRTLKPRSRDTAARVNLGLIACFWKIG